MTIFKNNFPLYYNKQIIDQETYNKRTALRNKPKILKRSLSRNNFRTQHHRMFTPDMMQKFEEIYENSVGSKRNIKSGTRNKPPSSRNSSMNAMAANTMMLPEPNLYTARSPETVHSGNLSSKNHRKPTFRNSTGMVTNTYDEFGVIKEDPSPK